MGGRAGYRARIVCISHFLYKGSQTRKIASQHLLSLTQGQFTNYNDEKTSGKLKTHITALLAIVCIPNRNHEWVGRRERRVGVRIVLHHAAAGAGRAGRN